MAPRLSDRRRIGETGLELPVFGFGAAHLGELYARVEESRSHATLQSAWDAGIRYFDTAPWYGRGLSEHRLGGFLRTQPRDQFLLTTKVGRTLKRPANPAQFDRSPWVGGLNFEVVFDYSYDGIMRSYEQAMQRLAIDTIDALVIHDLEAAYHAPDAFAAHQRDLVASGMKALEELKAAGDIKAYGMGVNTSEALEKVASQVQLDFALVAMPYTLLDQSSLYAGLKTCIDNKTSVIIGAPFASGILVTGSGADTKYGYDNAPAAIQQKVRDIEAVCADHSVGLPAAALQFVLAHPAVAAVIPGAARPEEVTQNIASLQAQIPSAFWADLKAKSLIDPQAPTPSGSN
ncbi:aldo/keto reductase [Devosia rhodophyticola]|uniref:Aldo/keto reductase n=1 Tax=Devosia rhodophyticola TaxID=3026423 RepID=A0ABY7Z111_9HYPH|nr:aldo/keto reductase [Devosia rhodophyticola]WDR06705.1 aldo/keto reductase [Devosia rhodophyticola]